MFTGTPRAPTRSDPELYQKYWPGESEEDEQADDDGLPSRRLGLLQSLRVFCSRPGSPLEDLTPEEVLRAHHALYLDWNALVGQDGPFPHHNPPQGHTAAEVLTCLALAAHEQLLQRCPVAADPSHIRLRLRSQRLHVRPQSLQPLTPMRSLKSDKIGKLVAVRGSVIRVSSLRPMVSLMEFACPRCGACTQVPLQDGKYTPPSKCPSAGCQVKNLTPVRSSADTRDWQKIRLQEVPDEAAVLKGSGTTEQQAHQEFYGRVPRSVEVELTEELVDCCVPGDLLVVAGLVKCLEVAAEGGGGGGRGGGNRNKCMYLLYVEALSVSNAKAGAADPRQDSALAFSHTELLGIRSIAGESHLFNLLVNSLSPAIFGHEIVKAGLLLGLLGGTPAACADGALHAGARSDVHVLVVGDPGMGKSQMLTAAASLAPRGVYVCGNTSSSSGLTVTVVKDAITGDYALEAGALVMGDQGVCCIDEFDKMDTAQHQALLEAMEQQSISIAKAGIVCTLSARTAVLAAANPVGGHYRRDKTVCENLKLPSNVLSRFDLIFVLLDRPDEAMDQMLSRHVMALHAASRASDCGGPGQGRGGRGGEAAAECPWEQEAGYDEWRQKQPLSLRLRQGAEGMEPVPGPLLRKYIAYARTYCHPVLGEKARAVLSAFYLQLRKTQRGGDSVPITTRQLESLVRLAEARAKAELREEVTEQDAHDAVEIVKESIVYNTLADLMGGMGAPPTSSAKSSLLGGGGGGGGGLASQGAVMTGSKPKVPLGRVVKEFMGRLDHEAHEQGNAQFSTAQMEESFRRTHMPNPKGSFRDLLEYLNREGYIIMKGSGQWKLASCSVRSSQPTGPG